jgi:hypothetical protein
MRLSPILVVRAHCRAQRQRQRPVLGRVVQQRAQDAQRGKIHKRVRQNPNGRTGRPIEHPGRQLLNHFHRRIAANAAKNVAGLPHDHLFNASEAAGPWMPRIQDLSLVGPVGVLSSCCTTMWVRIRASAISRRTSSWLDKKTRRLVRQRARALRYVGLRALARCTTCSARSTCRKQGTPSQASRGPKK